MEQHGALDDAAVEMVTLRRVFEPATVRERYDDVIAWPLFTHERRRWESPREFLDDLLSCRNEQCMFRPFGARLLEGPPVFIHRDQLRLLE